MLRLFYALLAVLALLGTACARDVIGAPPPLTEAHYPAGLAVHPNGRWLAVTSSNFDLEYSHGALLLADLDAVDAATAGVEEGSPIVVPGVDAYITAAQVPPFGNRPVFAFDGATIFLPTRAENLVVEVDLDGADTDAPSFVCDEESADGTPVCETAPRALQLPGNDPFELVVWRQSDTRADAVVSALGATQLFFLRAIPDNPADRRLQVEPFTLALEDLATDGEVLGVRGLTLRPDGDGVSGPRVFATLERTTSALRGSATDLIWFDPSLGRDAQLSRLLLTDTVGALGVRAVTVTPNGDALLVLLRDPDALLRVDLFTKSGAFSPRVGGLVSTCFAPTGVAAADIIGLDGQPRTRAYVTCFDNESVLAYDALTLAETDALRYFGRGPYQVAIDAARVPPRAYVSFFQDDSIGLIDLVDDDGDVRMVARGRIGQQRAEPEDGR